MNKTKNDISVEVLRVIAACMVIGTHISINMELEGLVSRARVIISCFVADGVAIFWMILGFFYFKNNNYKRSLKRMVKRILLPMFAYSAIMFYLYDFILGRDKTILASIRHTANEYKRLLTDGLLKWQSVVSGTGHFWYLYVYVLVILLFPFLKGINDYLGNDNKKRYLLFAILFALLVFNDLSFNGFFNFSHHTFNGAMGAMIWVLLGNIIYESKYLFKGNKKYGALGLIVFLAINLIRAYIQYKCCFIENKTTEPLYWYTCYAVVSVLGLTLFIYGFSDIIEKNRILYSIFKHLGKMTFLIYIFHVIVMDFLNKEGLKEWLLEKFGYGGIGVFTYEITYILIIFILSLTLGEVFCLIKVIFKNLYKRIFKHINTH